LHIFVKTGARMNNRRGERRLIDFRDREAPLAIPFQEISRAMSGQAVHDTIRSVSGNLAAWRPGRDIRRTQINPGDVPHTPSLYPPEQKRA
jgi:hypothetical protein